MLFFQESFTSCQVSSLCSQICHKLHEKSVAIINYLYALRQNHSIIYCNTNGEVHNMNVKTVFLALFSIVLLAACGTNSEKSEDVRALVDDYSAGNFIDDLLASFTLYV